MELDPLLFKLPRLRAKSGCDPNGLLECPLIAERRGGGGVSGADVSIIPAERPVKRNFTLGSKFIFGLESRKYFSKLWYKSS